MVFFHYHQDTLSTTMTVLIPESTMSLQQLHSDLVIVWFPRTFSALRKTEIDTIEHTRDLTLEYIRLQSSMNVFGKTVVKSLLLEAMPEHITIMCTWQKSDFVDE